jgi:nucleotide-binding universal stress UspA family protein
MKVLLAINGFRRSAVLDEVASRRWPAGTEVKIVTVIHDRAPQWVNPAFVMAAADVEATQERRRRARELLEAATARIRQDLPGLSVATKTLEGMPRDIIIREAANWGADLIVLGSHWDGPPGHAVLGSVAAGVAAGAMRAVDIIRAGARPVTARSSTTAGSRPIERPGNARVGS